MLSSHSTAWLLTMIRSMQLIVKAIQSRWVIAGGLENHPWSKRDLLNLPPDRSMLGRAFWTVSVKCYSVHRSVNVARIREEPALDFSS